MNIMDLSLDGKKKINAQLFFIIDSYSLCLVSSVSSDWTFISPSFSKVGILSLYLHQSFSISSRMVWVLHCQTKQAVRKHSLWLLEAIAGVFQ